MKTDRVLIILGQDMQADYHHRGQHLVSFLAKRFVSVDLVSIANMYAGSEGDSSLKKAVFGLRDVIWKGVEVVQKDNVVNYVVRFPRRPAAVDYLFRDLWSYARLGRYLNHYYDLCIIGHPRMSFIALRLQQLHRVGVLIYDDWDHFSSHRPGGFVWRNSMRLREYICVRKADAVASVSHGLLELRRKQGAKRSIFVPNGVDYALFSRAQVRSPHPPTLIYMGNLDEAWGADLPIHGLPVIRKTIPAIRYVLLGTGPDEGRLRRLVADLGLEACVEFYGWQDYATLPSHLAKADIGVATYRDYEFVRLSRPLKIIEYMAAGLPVIGTRVAGEVQATIDAAAAGETIDFSPAEFARVTLDLLSNRQKYDQCSANAISYARSMGWDQLLENELVFIDDVWHSRNG